MVANRSPFRMLSSSSTFGALLAHNFGKAPRSDAQRRKGSIKSLRDAEQQQHVRRPASKSADSKTAYSFEAAVSILPIRLERFSLEHGPSCLSLGEPEKIDPSPARHSFGTGRCPNPLFHISLPACRAECPELWPAPHSHRPVLIVRL